MKKSDLEKLWDEHTKYEFATPDVEATLATMVEDAYVNHVPVMTGGKGKSAPKVLRHGLHTLHATRLQDDRRLANGGRQPTRR